MGQKERKVQPRHPSWKKSRDMQSVDQKKNKTHHKRCYATITRVLTTSGANYKIDLNFDSEFSYLTDHQGVSYRPEGRYEFLDDPLRCNFSRRIPTRDLS